MQISGPVTETFYRIEESSEILTRTKDNFLAISIDVVRNRVLHKRSVYTALDLLRDVGGLLNLLTIFGKGIVYGINLLVGDPLETYLAEGLLKMENRQSGV